MRRLTRFAGLALASCSAALLQTLAHAAALPEPDVGHAKTDQVETDEALPSVFPMEEFLDRLMTAESGGRRHTKNPRSTALGPFQFIESTFLAVTRKHFPFRVARLTNRQVLALRTDMAFSRRAARAYVNDLISVLRGENLPATAINVRIAFLVGPSAAVRLLRSPPDQPLSSVLSAEAIAANPFMSGATITKLVNRAAAEVGATATAEWLGPSKGEPAAADASKSEPVAPVAELKDERVITAVASAERVTPAADALGAPETAAVALPLHNRCNVGLASCRRWMALREQVVRSAER